MKRYTLASFGHITSAFELISTELFEKELPSVESVMALATWNSDMLHLFEVSKEDATRREADGTKGFDRSSALMRMAYHGAEQGWADEQIMAVMLHLDDRWEKYTARSDREYRYLLPMLNRARQKHGHGSLSELAQGMLSVDKVETTEADDGEKWAFSVSELMAVDDHLDWELRDLLIPEGFVLITGRQGTGKTQLALQLAGVFATGAEKFIQWPNDGGTKKVLFLSLEMGKHGMRRFIPGVHHTYGGEDLDKNLTIIPHGEPIAADTPAGQALISSLCDRFQPDVLIIDSLETLASKELTDETVVKTLINYLVVTKAKYGFSLFLIHHHRKRPNDVQSQKRDDTLYDVFGSNYITTKVDAVLNVSQTATANVLTMSQLKNRYAAMMEPVEIIRDKHLQFEVGAANVSAQFGAGEDDETPDDGKARFTI